VETNERQLVFCRRLGAADAAALPTPSPLLDRKTLLSSGGQLQLDVAAIERARARADAVGLSQAHRDSHIVESTRRRRGSHLSSHAESLRTSSKMSPFPIGIAPWLARSVTKCDWRSDAS
jgi:hypothetical protein